MTVLQLAAQRLVSMNDLLTILLMLQRRLSEQDPDPVLVMNNFKHCQNLFKTIFNDKLNLEFRRLEDLLSNLSDDGEEIDYDSLVECRQYLIQIINFVNLSLIDLKRTPLKEIKGP